MENVYKIRKIFNNYSESKNFSGVALIKKERSEVFSYNYGYVHRGYSIENSITTKFDTSSITKLFTSVSIFQLIDKKLITLQDKVLEILDLGSTSISKEVTIFDKISIKNTVFLNMDGINENTAEGYECLVDEDNKIIGLRKNIY